MNHSPSADRARSTDLIRGLAVLVTSVAEVASSPVTTAVLGTRADNKAISDANNSPLTPAGYAFAIWGLIYLASLALAVHQLLPSQRSRPVHRRTGWWLTGAFLASTVWVPIFGSGAIWVSQVVILLLVAFLTMAVLRLTRLGPAETNTERLLLRLPVTLYLGWATFATMAGFGTTFRSLGMPERAGWVTALSLVLVLVTAAVSIGVVWHETAVAGFAFTACWALVGVAVATDEVPVKIITLLALVALLAAVLVRSVRSLRGSVVLFG